MFSCTICNEFNLIMLVYVTVGLSRVRICQRLITWFAIGISAVCDYNIRCDVMIQVRDVLTFRK